MDFGNYSLVIINKTIFGDYNVFPKRSWTGAAGPGQTFDTLGEAIATAESWIPKMQLGSRICNNAGE